MALVRPQQYDTFLEKFSTKIQFANPAEYFRKLLALQQKSLVIGDRASANEYTAFSDTYQGIPSFVWYHTSLNQCHLS